MSENRILYTSVYVDGAMGDFTTTIDLLLQETTQKKPFLRLKTVKIVLAVADLLAMKMSRK